MKFQITFVSFKKSTEAAPDRLSVDFSQIVWILM